MCDRRRGVGADGVLELLSPSPPAVARMKVTNSDGSSSEMCGNGLRCVARYLADHEGAVVALIETDAGLLRTTVTAQGVEVGLGPVHDFGELELDLGSEKVRGRHVALGNPHFVAAGPRTQDDMLRLGPKLQTHDAFPGGVNAGFARLSPDGTVKLHVWERGCGPTLACGTGAGAAVATAWLRGDLPSGVPVWVHLPGGALLIDGSLDDLRMSGPAVCVFEGRLRADFPDPY